MICVELSVAVDGVKDSAFSADLRVSDIEGFSQKITMKMNRISGEDSRDLHLRQDIFNPTINIPHQVDVNTFMGMSSHLFLPPPLSSIVEEHTRQEKKVRDSLQVIELHQLPKE